MSEQREKLLDAIRETHFYDVAYFEDGEDSREDYYFIFDGWDSHNKFVDFAGEVLNLSDDELNGLEDVLDAHLVFSDEYTTCSDCHKVIRTSADSYHWQPDFYVGDGFIACSECFQSEPDYQEAYLEEKINDPSTANEVLTDAQLEGFGFKRYNEELYENGYHEGQTDDPKRVYLEIQEVYDDGMDVVFSIDEASQFYIKFSVWVREVE